MERVSRSCRRDVPARPDIWTTRRRHENDWKHHGGRGRRLPSQLVPDGQWIAFTSDRGTRIERDPPEWEHFHRTSIYLIRPDGSGLRRLTDGNRFSGSPRWSPDGKRIVFYEMDVIDTLKARDDPERQSQVVSQIVSVDIETGTRL